ncbi:MAG TPA: DnaJ C-terminal domain-containing protein [Cellvibrio sp.]|nr:DnaJ C-terminal domain-containing protein [Cellvibrio sp.]
MEFKDYYQILGVAKTATADDIKKAYRKLARKYHPDVSKEADAEKHMRDINEARDVLSDPEKRAAYDQVGQGYRPGQEFHPPPNWDRDNWDAGYEYSGRGFSGADTADFSDFFANLFGQGRRTSGFRERGSDRHAKIQIDLADTYQGATKTITLQTHHVDERGRTSLNEHSLKVHIPKGVKEGQHIRLSGKGNPGVGGGGTGDLYLEIHFKPDPRYRVDGTDVYASLPVTPWEAALGGVIEAPTPSGTVKLTIPPNSQAGRKLRLKGRGIPADEPGDLYMELAVVLPSADTRKAQQLYETMAKELNFNPRK